MSKGTLRVALVTESLWTMGGANRVLETFAKLYPQADIYALFGDTNNLSEELQKHKIVYSSLNKKPFIKKLYRYSYHLWPMHIEKFDFHDYDFVISSSCSVAMGVVTPITCKHIAYIHSPMRYLWDLKEVGLKGIGFVRRAIANFFLVFIRIWEVSASVRPDVLISNSKFVAKRIEKYWGRNIDYVLTPPIHFHNSPILNDKQRESYFVAGAPFEFNKKGDFLLECFAGTDKVLKLIGSGSKERGLKRKYSKFKNIQFLGKISDEEKWDVLSKATGFVMPGFEDYGIFPLEAMSVGTPVLAYKAGGIQENLIEDVNGYFFTEWDKENSILGLKKILKKKWDYKEIAQSVRKGNNSEEEFIEKFKKIIS